MTRSRCSLNFVKNLTLFRVSSTGQMIAAKRNIVRLLLVWLCLAAPARAEDAEFRGKPVEHWVGQLQDPDIRARWYAAYALGQIGPAAADASADLVKVLGDWGQYEYVRGMAAWALGRIGVADQPVVDILIEDLRSKLVSVRRNSARALGTLGEPAKPAVAELARLLDDPDATARVNAAGALWQIDRHGRAIPVLLEMLHQPAGPGPYQAADCLGRIGQLPEPALIGLVDALKHPSADVRRVAARSLGRIGPTVVPRLARPLGDSDESVRLAAVETLGWIGRPAVAGLIKMLGDPQPAVRMTAARALGRLGPDAEDAVAALKQAVNDPDRQVRQIAAQALARTRSASKRP